MSASSLHYEERFAHDIGVVAIVECTGSEWVRTPDVRQHSVFTCHVVPTLGDLTKGCSTQHILIPGLSDGAVCEVGGTTGKLVKDDRPRAKKIGKVVRQVRRDRALVKCLLRTNRCSVGHGRTLDAVSSTDHLPAKCDCPHTEHNGDCNLNDVTEYRDPRGSHAWTRLDEYHTEHSN